MRQGFKQDEAEQILTEAVRRASEERTATLGPDATVQVEIPPERLRAMAEELGIPLATLESVLRDREVHATRQADQTTLEEERRAFIVERHATFYPHLWSYVGVIGMLVVIYLMTTPRGYFWPAWPALGWMLGLFLHGVLFLPTRGAYFEHEFAGWRERRRRKLEAETERKRSAQEAMERGDV
jgi:hypothetical protein